MASRHKTQGIVIHSIKYAESSLIVRVYTEMFGLQSYLVNGVRKSKSKQNIALYQPLTLLDMVVYHQKEVQKLFRIAELRCWRAFISIPLEVKKISIALFLSEVLHKTLKEETAQANLFFFLRDSLLIFDEMPQEYENFHLAFLLKFAQYLGIAPENSEEILQQINQYKPLPFLAEAEQQAITALEHFSKQDYRIFLPISTSLRTALIDILIDFYSLHIAGFGSLKSLAVLRETMRNS